MYGTDTSKWSALNITTAGGIISGLSASDVGALKFTTLESIKAIGEGGDWTGDKVRRTRVADPAVAFAQKDGRRLFRQPGARQTVM